MINASKLPEYFNKFTTEQPLEYTDLHIHTEDSDGLIKTDFLEDFLQNIPHLISITDHNSINNNLKLCTTTDLNVVPGIEVGCKDSFEFLIYFNTPQDLEDFYINSVEPFKNRYKITRTEKMYQFYLKEAKKYDSFISIPHIAGVAQKNYLKNKPYIKKVLQEVDALEIYNHAIPKNRNLIAQRLSTKENKLITFGSDAHIKKEIISFHNFQNNEFSKFSHFKKNFYNVCSIVALFGKHLFHLLEIG
ncbi:PHP domain-containing protein [Natroniella sulfidigena]|uniref:PHP domain-containing protein n=1 Tax=Natroniella sulfidigena TaxID=723921 RepID=UPI00200A4266|nr:PHP domain-containing protein [Natroniella sulfidigena]MCK8817633.1 PHP domain-containing protein [Natroniella sulfidigena]